jgi:O-antigen/teichoic acid export membrane protein
VLLVALATRAPSWGLFIAWSIPIMVALLPINWLIFRRLVPRHASRPAAGPAFGQVRRFASANYVGTLFSLASTTLLPIIVTNQLGTTATAHFYVAWSIAVGLQLVASGSATAFTAEAAASEQMLRDYCRRTTAHALRLATPLVVVLFVTAPWVLRLFGGDYARDATTLLRLLAVVGIPSVVTAIGQGVARVQNDRRSLVLAQVVQCVLTLALAVALVSPMGIVGVGIAALVGQVAAAAGLLLGPLGSILLRRPAPASVGGGGGG